MIDFDFTAGKSWLDASTGPEARRGALPTDFDRMSSVDQLTHLRLANPVQRAPRQASLPPPAQPVDYERWTSAEKLTFARTGKAPA